MRRTHVYERSVPAMIQDAEAAGLTIIADHLIRALKVADTRSAEHDPSLERTN